MSRFLFYPFDPSSRQDLLFEGMLKSRLAADVLEAVAANEGAHFLRLQLGGHGKTVTNLGNECSVELTFGICCQSQISPANLFHFVPHPDAATCSSIEC